MKLGDLSAKYESNGDSGAISSGEGDAGGLSSPDKGEDASLIRAIYDIRALDEWTAGSPELRPGLVTRFEAECRDALVALDSVLRQNNWQ